MKKPDSVTSFAATMPYPTHVGAPAFTVPDVLQHKKERGVTATHFFETKFDELKEEYFKLVKLAEDTQLVYEASYSFLPVVGKTYSLYVKNEKLFLSIIEPQRWPQMTFKGSFKFTSDNTWEKIEASAVWAKQNNLNRFSRACAPKKITKQNKTKQNKTKKPSSPADQT